MTVKTPIPQGALVLAADAGKALIFRNEAAGPRPKLATVETILAPENPSTAEQGTDRPGKAQYRGRSAAVGQTDWHAQEEARFAVEAAKALDAALRKSGAEAVVIAAPPAFLGELRKHLSAAVKGALALEVAKDVAHAPTADIESVLSAE